MSAAPTADDLRRLTGIMELACRGATDGERLAGLDRAKHWCDARGLRWAQVLSGVAARVPPPPPSRGWQEAAQDLQRKPVNEWESEFLDSIQRWSGLSEKQENVLRRMCAKFGVAVWTEVAW
jgi:hypothetical protein